MCQSLRGTRETGSTQQPDYRTAIQALGIVAFGAKAATKTFPNSSLAAPLRPIYGNSTVFISRTHAYFTKESI